jgi:hypothetical protein
MKSKEISQTNTLTTPAENTICSHDPKKLKILSGVAILIISLIYICFGIQNKIEVKLSEEFLQTSIQKQLPKKIKGKIELEKAALTLKENNLEVNVTLNGAYLNRQFSIQATGAGTPTYNPKNGIFYFHPQNLKIEKITYIGENVEDKILGLIKNKELQNTAKIIIPKVTQWIEESAIPAGIEKLGEIPVYKVKNDTKGIILKSTLSKIKINEGNLELTFSLLQLTKTIGIAVFTVVAAIAFLVSTLRNPEIIGVTLLAI